MIYQPLLFAHIDSRYHVFKSEVLTGSHCEKSSVLGKAYGYNSDGVDTVYGYKENNSELHVSSICMPCSH